jgi:hypothetical protein
MTPWHLGARAVPELFSGPLGRDAVELTELHFNATSEYVEGSEPEAWRVSRGLVAWYDEDYSARSRAIEEKLRDIRRNIIRLNEEFELSHPRASEEFFGQASGQAGLVVEAMRGLAEEG